MIEVLVAISIIATVGFIPISVVTRHLIQNALTPNRVKAELLAQEIIEYVRYTRDSDMLDDDPDTGGDWFDSIYQPGSSDTEYTNCVVFADDWISGTAEKYCRVECFAGINENEEPEACGTKSGEKVFDGFVAGIDTDAAGGEYGNSNANTCDGTEPKTDNQFTAILNIIIPREEGGIRYAAIAPCVSWSNRSGVIKKVALQETVFEWIKRE